MAKVRRSSNRTANELTHCTAQELAAICGVSTSAIYGWKRIATFPPLNDDGDYCIRDCCWWYLVNRAALDHRKSAFERLGRDLVEAAKPEPVAGTEVSSEKAAGELSYKQHVEILELRTKEAAYQLKYGDAVRMRHIVPALAALAQKIRQWAEGVEQKTGHPIVNVIDQAVEQAVSEMSQKAGGIDGHAID